MVSQVDVTRAYVERPGWKHKAVPALTTPREGIVWILNRVCLLEVANRDSRRDMLENARQTMQVLQL